MKILSFYIIGKGPLSLSIANCIIDLGHKINGIKTEDANLSAFAHKNKISLNAAQTGSDYIIDLTRHIKDDNVITYHMAPYPKINEVGYLNYLQLENKNTAEVCWYLAKSHKVLVRDHISVNFVENNSIMKQCENAVVESFEQVIFNLSRNYQAPVTEEMDNNLVEKAQMAFNLMLHEWNKTERPYPYNQSIVDLFMRQMHKAPQKVAVVHGNRQISYLELNILANKMAHFIDEKIGKKRQDQTPIAFLLNRSIETIALILAIFKLNGISVPIYKNTPSARVKKIVENCDARIIVGNNESIANLEQIDFTNIPLINIEKNIDTILSIEAPEKNDSKSQSLAYIRYTTGSTGDPKGVEIQQTSLVEFVQDTSYININVNDNVAFASSVAFDAVPFEIWVPLTNGAKVTVIDEDILLLPRLLTKELRQHAVNIMWLTAGLFDQYVINGFSHAFSELKYLLVGGDVVKPHSVRRFLSTVKNTRLLDCYGPTENTVFTTCYAINSIDKTEKPIPIGKPIANTKVYILDENRQLVPIGEPGTLYISSPRLARGYCHDQRLTDEKFIINPFNKNDHPDYNRLYNSGDWACWDVNGDIHFLGRKDGQEKILGKRVDRIAIEAEINKQVGVSISHIVIRTTDQTKSIVAFIVPNKKFVNIKKLISSVNTVLPDYMQPKEYHVIDQLPLNINGKIDNKKLLADISEKRPPVQDITDQTQKKIYTIWENLLQRKNISINDDYFDLGGNSINSVRLLLDLEAVFPADLNLGWLMQHRTIKQQAASLEQQTQSDYKAVISLNKGTTPPLILVHPGGDGANIFIPLSKFLPKKTSLYAIESYNMSDNHDKKTSVNEIAAYYTKELLKLNLPGPYFLGGYSLGGIIAFRMAELLHKQGVVIPKLYIIDTPLLGDLPQDSKTDRRIKNELIQLSYDLIIQSQFHQSMPDAVKKRREAAMEIDKKLFMHFNPQYYAGQALLIHSKNYFPADVVSKFNVSVLNRYLKTNIAQWQSIIKHLQTMQINYPHAQLLVNTNSLIQIANTIAQDMDEALGKIKRGTSNVTTL